MIRKTFYTSVALVAGFASASALADVFNAAVVIENQAIVITQDAGTSLDFGALTRPVVGTTATYDLLTTGVGTASAGTSQNGTPDVAEFTITGDALSAPDISLTFVAGSDTNGTSITNFNIDYDGTTATGTGTLVDEGAALGAGKALKVGGTIQISDTSISNAALQYNVDVSYD